MSDVQVRANRLRRPSWHDPRLVVGVLVVLLSVVVGARVMAGADTTVPVYAAAGTFASGHVLGESDVRVVRVRLDGGTAGYLSARRPLPQGLVLARPVGAPASLTRRPVSVPLPPPVPVGLRAGAAVDLWSSAKQTSDGATGYRPPERIAASAEVYAVTAARPGLGAASGDAVEVLLDDRQVRAVLDALANGAKIAVVPAPGGIPAALGDQVVGG